MKLYANETSALCRRQLRNPVSFSVLSLILLFVFTACMPFLSHAEEKVIPVPANPHVSVEDTDAVFSWDSVLEGDCYYHVQMSKNENWDTPEEDVTTWGNSYNFYSLTKGEKYAFRVQAVQEVTEETWSEEAGDYISTTTTYYSEWSEIVTALTAYKAPQLTSVQSAGAAAITLKWNTLSDAQTYRIYRCESADGNYQSIAIVTNSDYADAMSYTDKNVHAGTTYYYKVCAYNPDFTYPDGYLSEALSASPIPARLKLAAKAASYSSIHLSWKKGETGVSGYKIYQAESKNGSYKRIKTITDPKTTSYVKKKLTIGKNYYYKIISYTTVNDKNYYGDYSSIIKAVPSVIASKIQTIKLAGITKAELTWEKVPGAHGYVIYRASSKDGTYKKIGAVKSSKKFTYTASGMKNGRTYYFKVKAYRTVKEKNYYGPASAIKRKLMNKLGYAGEPYESRCNRIWKTDHYKDYTSSKAASKDMTKISVKVWDIKSSGKKYSRTMSLSVHKNIAPTVKQIFKEIYNGSEKFPIHSLGGYSWRGDSSSSEHCEGLAIDINPNENAMISKTDGKVLSGSFYKPGKNPYSIPKDGDVVKAFEKYGFYWGDWSTKRDYMHFSYFGN
ncbi:MAG: fibronectin type III domain-containing protein [Lachnospiraceae bacterium]|nr:fibronectin type III domain-containing protein [Lachnospiraceae bacterium]